MTSPKGPKSPKLPVGYRQPPVEHQFKKGQSGNSRGRPRKPRTPAGILNAELGRLVTVTVAGSTFKVTAYQALVMRQINDGIQGDAKAAAQVLRWIDYFGADPDEGEVQAIGDMPSLRRAFAGQSVADPKKERARQTMVDLISLGYALKHAGMVVWDEERRIQVRRSRLERLLDEDIDEKERERVFEECREFLID